jgi:tetratricopeptide (TPR) repeat protein
MAFSPDSSEPKLDAFSEADLRFWCVGGWRFQMRGGKVHPLDKGGAEQALARHLAIRQPKPLWSSELEAALSRDADELIPRTSLHVAGNKLRGLLKEAAGGGEDAARLAKELLPRASGLGSDLEMPDDPAYSFTEGRVWIDLLDAPDAFALAPPSLDADDRDQLVGGPAASGFAGSDKLREEVEERVKAARAIPPIKVPQHLKGFRPPISTLSPQIPVALDRLRPGCKVLVEGPADSGRLHFAEAIELAAQAWCGRSTLQIREWTESEEQDLLPGHVYCLDLTRQLTKHQEKALRAICEATAATEERERPAMLLVVEEEAEVPDELGLDLWQDSEPIRLPRAKAAEAMEAYLIATREDRRDLAVRRTDFERLSDEYERKHEVEIGLRAASAAAAYSIKNGSPPKGARLPSPTAADLPLRDLDEKDARLAKALAWFSNSMFTLEDARAAAGDETLSLEQVLALATQIPGGGSGAFELRPQLISATPAPQIPERMCDYLLRQDEDAAGRAIERWPERAISILEKRFDPSKRFRLVPCLIQPCRERGSMERLAQAVGRLLIGHESSMTLEPTVMEAMIWRGRLLAELGKAGEAELLLAHVTRQRESKQRRPLKMDAHLRLAIVTAQGGRPEEAREHAEKALQLSDGALEGRIIRFFGWEAMFDARFRTALAEFQKPVALEGSDEDKAEALLGATQALLRLGRLQDASANLPVLERLDISRATRDRVSRIEARASFLRGQVTTGIEILNKALPRGDSGITFESAHLLEARSYLRALNGEVMEATRDLERCEVLVRHPRPWKRALLHYVRALIYEKQALLEETGAEPARICRVNARRKAEESLGEAGDNPWHRVRAHTLLARIAYEEGDRKLLGFSLRSAHAAHRDLRVVCPDVLFETITVALLAADQWQMPRTREKIDSVAACLAPRDVPLAIDLDYAVGLISEVSEAVLAEEPPGSGASAQEPNLWMLGRVAHAIVDGGQEILASGLAPRFRVIYPRESPGLERGIYEFEPAEQRLVAMGGSRVPALVRGTANRRFATQRLGAILVVGTLADASAGTEEPNWYLLSQWAEALRQKALAAGVAAIERFPLEPDAVEALGLDLSLGFLSLGLAELPTL